MGITLNRIAFLARFFLLPVIVIGNFAISWLPIERGEFLIRFGSGYITMVVMLLAFRRSSAAGLAIAAAILLVIACTTADGLQDVLPRVISALAGVVCAAMPACVRDWQRLAGNDEHMGITQLRKLRRRKKQVYLLPPPQAAPQERRSSTQFETSDMGHPAR